jgi:NAD(P)-dependent dehydrogenase (short-subunit alcohol dehydrogenase family)
VLLSGEAECFNWTPARRRPSPLRRRHETGTGHHLGPQKFDYLVNNAGIGIYAPFAETTEADFDRLMDIHLKGVFFLTQTLLPLIADDGRVVNISSRLARFSLSGYAAYAMMKGGVEVLTRYLAKELASRGIAANTMAPSAIETGHRRRLGPRRQAGQ